MRVVARAIRSTVVSPDPYTRDRQDALIVVVGDSEKKKVVRTMLITLCPQKSKSREFSA